VVEQTGDLENTLIIYIAGDNGPTPEGGLHGTMNKLSYFNGVAESVDEVAGHIDDLGGPKTHGAYPAAWAYATATPFTYGKGVTSGGGCSTGAVVSWPARIKDHGGIRRQFHHHVDITPTILESAGVPEPTGVNGDDQMPMAGVSIRSSERLRVHTSDARSGRAARVHGSGMAPTSACFRERATPTAALSSSMGAAAVIREPSARAFVCFRCDACIVRRPHAPAGKAVSCDEERVNWNSGGRRAGLR
jgi:Sulfatase